MALALPSGGCVGSSASFQAGPLADRVRQQTESRQSLQAALPQPQTGYSATPASSTDTVLEVLAPGGPLRAVSPNRGPGSSSQMPVPSTGLMSEGGGHCYGNPWGGPAGWQHGAPATGQFLPNSAGCLSAPALPSQGLGSSCSSTASLPYLAAPALVGFGMPPGNLVDTSLSLSAASLATPTAVGSGPHGAPPPPPLQQHPPPAERGLQPHPLLDVGGGGAAQTGPTGCGWGWQGGWTMPPLGVPPPPPHGGEPACGSGHLAAASAAGQQGPGSSSGGLTPPAGLVAPTLSAPQGLFPGPVGFNNSAHNPDSARSASPPPPPSGHQGPSPPHGRSPQQESRSSGSEGGEGGSDLIAFARRVLGLSPAASKRPGAGSGLESDWMDVGCLRTQSAGSRPEVAGHSPHRAGGDGGDAGTSFWHGAACDSRAPSFSFQGNHSRDPSRSMADFGNGPGDVWSLPREPVAAEISNPTSPTPNEGGTLDVVQGIEALVLAEAWVANYDASSLASSSVLHYPSGATVHLQELGALLRSAPLASSTSTTWPGQSSHASVASASQIAAAERYLSEQDHPRDLLLVYTLFDRERRGFLCWEEGQLVAFLEHLFRQRALPAPSESQIYAAYTIFDPRRSMRLSARECLCLADALLRASVWQQQAATGGTGSKPAPPQHSRSSGEDLASFELSLSEEEVSGVHGRSGGGGGGASTVAAARSPAEALAQAKAETQRLRRELEYLKALEAEEAAEDNAGEELPPPARHSSQHQRESQPDHHHHQQQQQGPDSQHDQHHHHHLQHQHGGSQQQPPPRTITLGDRFDDEGEQAGPIHRPEPGPEALRAGSEPVDTSALVEAARAHADNTRLERELQTLRAVASRQQAEARWLRQLRAQMTMAAREASEKNALEERRRELEQKEKRLQELEKETERRQERLQAMEEELLRRGRPGTGSQRSATDENIDHHHHHHHPHQEREREREDQQRRDRLYAEERRKERDEQKKKDEEQQEQQKEREHERAEQRAGRLGAGGSRSGSKESSSHDNILLEEEGRRSSNRAREAERSTSDLEAFEPDLAGGEDDEYQRRLAALKEREAEVERLQQAAERQRAVLEYREQRLRKQEEEEEEEARNNLGKWDVQGRGQVQATGHDYLEGVPTPATAGLHFRSRRAFGGPWRRGQFATEAEDAGGVDEEQHGQPAGPPHTYHQLQPQYGQPSPTAPGNSAVRPAWYQDDGRLRSSNNNNNNHNHARRHLFEEPCQGEWEEDYDDDEDDDEEEEAVAAARAELENRRLRRELEGLRSLAEWQQGEVAAYSSAAAAAAAATGEERRGPLPPQRRSSTPLQSPLPPPPAPPTRAGVGAGGAPTSHLAALRFRDPMGFSTSSSRSLKDPPPLLGRTAGSLSSTTLGFSEGRGPSASFGAVPHQQQHHQSSQREAPVSAAFYPMRAGAGSMAKLDKLW